MKRAIFVRSKMTIMAELEEKELEKKESIKLLYGAALLISCWLFLNSLPELQGIVLL